MSGRRLLASSLIGLLVFISSLIWVAHVQNTRTETTRLAGLSMTTLDQTGDVARGELVARAGGCIACHTDTAGAGKLLAGGVELVSPFGTFVSPNISSDPDVGIGSWDVQTLAVALLNGRRPDGNHYWPAFPYPAYAAMSGEDIVDVFAYLQASDPVGDASAPHDLLVPDMARSGLGVWKSLYVPTHYQPDTFTERGEYLVEGPAHCAACHAQRDLLGGVRDRALTGNSRGPEGADVPAITADALAQWTHEDLVFFLEIGMTPEGDFSGGHMAVVIEQGTAHLPATDLDAMATYLKSSANGGPRR